MIPEEDAILLREFQPWSDFSRGGLLPVPATSSDIEDFEDQGLGHTMLPSLES